MPCGNDTALVKEGRSSGQSLLAWGRHLNLADADGTVWMLVPTDEKHEVSGTEQRGRAKRALAFA